MTESWETADGGAEQSLDETAGYEPAADEQPPYDPEVEQQDYDDSQAVEEGYAQPESPPAEQADPAPPSETLEPEADPAAPSETLPPHEQAAAETAATGLEPEPPPAEDASATAEAPPLEPEAQSPEQAPPTAEQPPSEPFVFEGDAAAWSQPGLPEDWICCEPPVEPSPDSWTELGYSSDWGTIEPDWQQQGQEPFSVVSPERPLSSVVGPGHQADVYWGDQGQTNYCGIYSTRAILSELYGVQFDPGEMVQRAEANGWLVKDAQGGVLGIMPDNIDDILASYGVPSHNVSGEQGGWQALNDALANNQRVVLNLDGKEIDASANVGDVAGAIDSDHFVAVTGVDYGRDVVIVNDSARGAGLEIPMSVFYDSWRDSDFRMTITDVAAPGAGGASPPAGAEGPLQGAPGYAALGMSLHPLVEQGDSQAPALADMPADGEAATGTWWSSATAPEDAAIVPQDASGEPLEFVDSGGEGHPLPGVDTRGAGTADLTALDANQDGKVDTWLSDPGASGKAGLMFYDTDGDGRPDAFSGDPQGTGRWSEPQPVAALAETLAAADESVPQSGPVTGDPEAVSPVLSGVLCSLLDLRRAVLVAAADLPASLRELLAAPDDGGEGVLRVDGGGAAGLGGVVAAVGGLFPGDGLEEGQMALLPVMDGGDSAEPGYGVLAPTGCPDATQTPEVTPEPDDASSVLPADTSVVSPADPDTGEEPDRAPDVDTPGDETGDARDDAGLPSDGADQLRDDSASVQSGPRDAPTVTDGTGEALQGEPPASYRPVSGPTTPDPAQQVATEAFNQQFARNALNTINGQMSATASNTFAPTGTTASYDGSSVVYDGFGRSGMSLSDAAAESRLNEP